MGGVIRRQIERPKPEVVAQFEALPSSIVSDAMNRANAMRATIKSLRPGVRCVGTAVTVQSMVGCNLMSHQAIYLAKPGDVLVIDGRGHVDTSIWGFVQTRACQIQGLAGVVIDGSVRDSAEIRECGYPVFCAGASPLGPHKGWGDSINLPIQCGGVRVAPGDIVVADDDGVVVVPQEWAERVAEAARACLEAEKGWFERLEQGESTVEILGLDQKIQSLGVQWE